MLNRFFFPKSKILEGTAMVETLSRCLVNCVLGLGVVQFFVQILFIYSTKMLSTNQQVLEFLNHKFLFENEKDASGLTLLVVILMISCARRFLVIIYGMKQTFKYFILIQTRST